MAQHAIPLARRAVGAAATATNPAPPHPGSASSGPVLSSSDTDRPPRLRRALSIAPDRKLSISEVSELLGITAHTARYYERAGLLEAARSQSGHRVYDSVTVERLDFLVRMRTSGMGISELRRYVDLIRAGDVTTRQRLQIMLDQRERIVSQLHQLELALVTTDYKIAKYGGAPGADPTPGNTAPVNTTPTVISSRVTPSEGEPS